MSRSRSVLCSAYLVIAALALVACWRQNVAFMNEAGVDLASGFMQFWPALLANRATTSITIDIFLFGLVAIIWMVIEARRLQIRFAWLYVVLSFAIAISVMFPIFLAARERRLHALAAGHSEVAPTALDLAGFGVFGVPIVLFALYTLAR
jgi:Protein of unknown function DUF2834